MISQSQIARLIESREYPLLVDRILSNGRCRSQSARKMLRDSSCAATAAIGLALQRLAELTYRPTPMADGLVHLLLQMQQPDGSFASSGTTQANLLAASATALRGILTWQAQHMWFEHHVSPEIEASIERGFDWLRSSYGTIDAADGAIGWTIVLWQLGDAQQLRDCLPFGELLNRLRDSDIELVEDELCRYAAAMAA